MYIVWAEWANLKNIVVRYEMIGLRDIVWFFFQLEIHREMPSDGKYLQ